VVIKYNGERRRCGNSKVIEEVVGAAPQKTTKSDFESAIDGNICVS